MHNKHDDVHRCTCVRYLMRMLSDIPKRNISYADVARCQNGYSTLALDGSDTLLTAVALQGSVPTYGKVLGVASAVQRAVQIPGEVYIINQSKQACCVYLVRRSFSKMAQCILHESPSTNTDTSDLPTKLPSMVCAVEGPDQVVPLLTYRYLLKYYTAARVTTCPPPSSFSQEEDIALHQFQARTFPTCFPCLNFTRSITQDSCPGCGCFHTTFHVTVVCVAILFHPLRTKELWEYALCDVPPEVRQALVQRACECAGGTPN